jgi:hypothetical protein
MGPTGPAGVDGTPGPIGPPGANTTSGIFDGGDPTSTFAGEAAFDFGGVV